MRLRIFEDCGLVAPSTITAAITVHIGRGIGVCATTAASLRDACDVPAQCDQDRACDEGPGIGEKPINRLAERLLEVAEPVHPSVAGRDMVRPILVRFAVFPGDRGIFRRRSMANQPVEPMAERTASFFELVRIDQRAIRFGVHMSSHVAESAP